MLRGSRILPQQLASSVVAAAALLGFPDMTKGVLPPDTALQVQVDVPGLIQLVKTNAKDPIQTVKQTADGIAPYVKITQFPTAKWEFVRDTIAGDAQITINGDHTADVSVASDRGIFDVQVNAFDTELSLTISNEYLPKLPLAEKRTIRDGVEPTVRAVAVQREETAIWDRTDLDVWSQGWTNRRILGGTALALGAAYGGSYAYYIAENDRAEAEAEQKKEAAIAKRKAAKKATSDTKRAAAKQKSSAVKKPAKAVRIQDAQREPKPSKYVVPQDDDDD